MSTVLDRPKTASAEPERLQFYADFTFETEMVTAAKAKSLILPGDAKAQMPGTAEPKAQTGDVLLKGYASTWVMDRDFEFILRSAYDKTLEGYLSHNPIVLWQHNHDWPLGQVLTGYTDDTGLAVEGYVRKPVSGEEPWKVSAYHDIKAGIVRTFSVGGWFTREYVEGEIFVTEIDLFEISVVSVPSNPISLFDASVKSFKGAEFMRPDNIVRHMRQLLGIDKPSDPAIVALDTKERRVGRYYELGFQFEKATGRPAPPHDAFIALTDGALKGAPEQEIEQGMKDLFLLLHGPDGQPKAGDATGNAAKAGRVLSKKNEEALSAAVAKASEAIADVQSVVDQVAKGEDAEDDKDPERHCPECSAYMTDAPGASCPNCGHTLPDEDAATGEPKEATGEAKGFFADQIAGEDLQERLWDGTWAFRQALNKVLDPDGDYTPDIGSINTADIVSVCNEYRDWIVALVNDAQGDATRAATLGEDLKRLATALPQPTTTKDAQED